MKQQETIQGFVFKSAQYYVSNDRGERVILQIDYKNNSYDIDRNNLSLTPEFERQLARIATDLLRRKHGVNFVKRVTT